MGPAVSRLLVLLLPLARPSLLRVLPRSCSATQPPVGSAHLWHIQVTKGTFKICCVAEEPSGDSGQDERPAAWRRAPGSGMCALLSGHPLWIHPSSPAFLPGPIHSVPEQNKHSLLPHPLSSLSAVMYGCEGWTVKKAERQRIDAFELWCWKRLFRVPWTARRSNQSILKGISPKCSLERLMLKLKIQFFGHLM